MIISPWTILTILPEEKSFDVQFLISQSSLSSEIKKSFVKKKKPSDWIISFPWVKQKRCFCKAASQSRAKQNLLSCEVKLDISSDCQNRKCLISRSFKPSIVILLLGWSREISSFTAARIYWGVQIFHCYSFTPVGRFGHNPVENVTVFWKGKNLIGHELILKSRIYRPCFIDTF